MAEERLSGDLGLISLFDVAQLLLVNRASGVLTIREGSIARFLYFGEGAIVNAVDEERREGDEAAFNVLTTLRGTFSFDPTKGPEMKLVTLPANALLMEAARRMDEQAAEAAEAAAAADGATTVDPNTAPRPSHLRSLDLLSEAFREISGARPRGSSEMGPIVFEHPDDIAVIRPGLPVRIRSHGEWRESGPAVDDVDIMAVRQRLLDGAAQLPTGPEGGARWRIRREGLSATVESFGTAAEEWLVLRPYGVDPPGAIQLRGPTDRLAALLRLPQVLVLVGGPEASLVNRLMHAIVRLWAETMNGTCVVLEHEAVHRHTDAAGTVLHALPHDGARLIRATQPELVAIEAGGTNAAGPGLLAALGCAPRLVAGVVAADSRPLVALWLSSIEQSVAHQLEARLSATPFGWVFATREQDGLLMFDAGLLERNAPAPAAAPKSKAA